MTEESKQYKLTGTVAPWYQGWDITEEQRDAYRATSRSSHMAKELALSGGEFQSNHPINVPLLDAGLLMPRCVDNGLRSLSLFSGGGGLDLGFDLAGFNHVASYEILPYAAETIRVNRESWTVFGGDEGDVTAVNWKNYRGLVDIVHGGPPCQPFSTAGRQQGSGDARDMFPEMVRAVLEIKPQAFLAENVPGLVSSKFRSYLDRTLFQPLSPEYTIKVFKLSAASFGVPQIRNRVFFVGFKNEICAEVYQPPSPTHCWNHLVTNVRSKNHSDLQGRLMELDDEVSLQRCMGAREALGLPDIGIDSLAPTIRSTLTGPRHTTSILSSTHAAQGWNKLGIWPNGVSSDRMKARNFPTKNGNLRLSVHDCTVLQGFPPSWHFEGAVYKALGQVGNSVCPPLAYWMARSVSQALDV